MLPFFILTRILHYGVENIFSSTPFRVLRRIFGAKRDEVTGEWRKL